MPYQVKVWTEIKRVQCSFIFVHFKRYRFTISKVLSSQRTSPAHDAKLSQHADGWGICSPPIRNENIAALVMKPKISTNGRSRQIELRKVTKASLQVAFSSDATRNAVTYAVAPNLQPGRATQRFRFFDPAALSRVPPMRPAQH